MTMPNYHRFASGSHFQINGHDVYGIPGDQIHEEMWDPCQLKGQLVMVDGNLYKVIGVETFLIHRSPSHPYRLPFGLMVERSPERTLIEEMSITKYADVEKAEVLSPEDHERIQKGLHRLGKTSLQDASEAERKRVLDNDTE